MVDSSRYNQKINDTLCSDISKLRRYIGIDSETEDDVKHYSMNTSYDKLVNMCKKAGVSVYDNDTKKYKTYDQLIKSCNTKKRELLKNYIMDIAQYSTKKGFEQIASTMSGNGTYLIKTKSTDLLSKVETIDKIVELLYKELHPKNNILSQLHVKEKHGDKRKNKFLLEEYVSR